MDQEVRLAHHGVVLRQLSQSVDATGVRENGCDTPGLVTAPLCVRF